MTTDTVRADTARNPDGVRAPRAGAFDRTHTHTRNPALLATSPRDELAAAFTELRGRGVTHPDEFAELEAQTILDTIRWYDAQGSRVTAGVLVLELRRGGKPGWQPPRRGLDVAAETEYGQRVVAWLRCHFPELDRPAWGPHPAAVVAVIRLHHQHGKGSLTAAEHGDVIRGAVRAWEAKWGCEGSPVTKGSA